MSTLIDAACEDSEELLDEHPTLAAGSVRGGSERLARLLFVTLEADHFLGQWPHPFAVLEESYQLEDVLFGRLLARDESSLDGDEAVRYLEQVVSLLQNRPPQMPPLYSFLSQKGEGSSAVGLGGSLRAQAGFDHCVLIDDAAGTAEDLRSRTTLETPSKQLRIVQQPVVDSCGGDLVGLLKIARTAQRYGRRFVLTVT